MEDFMTDMHRQMDTIHRSVEASMQGVQAALKHEVGPQMHVNMGSTTTMDADLGGATKLAIHAFSGSVVIHGMNSDTVRLTASGFEDPQHGSPVNIVRDDGGLRIETTGPHFHDDVTYRLEIPRECEISVNSIEADVRIVGTAGPLAVESVSGDISVSNVNGSCILRSADGDVSAIDVRGDTTTSSINGDISCTHLEGGLHIVTISGDVQVLHSSLQSASIESTNGDVSAETSLVADGVYTVRSVDGDISLRLRGDSDATVRILSQRGDVQSHLQADVLSQDSHSWEGRLGEGRAEVDIQSLHGDVRVAHAAGSNHQTTPVTPIDPIPPIPPVAPIPPDAVPSAHAPFSPRPATERVDSDVSATGADTEDSGDRTVAILAELERGDLTVEEAMTKLDSLRESSPR
ncbi:MAG: hypothetical protein NVSMB52_11340 [Chloroflexota bacterium]